VYILITWPWASNAEVFRLWFLDLRFAFQPRPSLPTPPELPLRRPWYLLAVVAYADVRYASRHAWVAPTWRALRFRHAWWRRREVCCVSGKQKQQLMALPLQEKIKQSKTRPGPRRRRLSLARKQTLLLPPVRWRKTIVVANRKSCHLLPLPRKFNVQLGNVTFCCWSSEVACFAHTSCFQVRR